MLGQGMVEASQERVPARLTMTEQLRQQKQRLEDQLKLINEALDGLESNPDVARVVDAVSRLGGIY